MGEVTKEYLDAKFDNLEDKIDRLDKNVQELFRSQDKHRELIGANDTAIQRMNDRLAAGAKSFEYIRQDISDLKGMKSQVRIMWALVTGIGGTMLVMASKIVFDLIAGS
jgi:chromosome segregation ATPase